MAKCAVCARVWPKSRFFTSTETTTTCTMRKTNILGRNPLQVTKPCVGARSQGHPEDGDRRNLVQDGATTCRRVVPFRVAANSFWRAPRILDPTAWTKSKRVRASWPRATMNQGASQAPSASELCPSVHDAREMITKLPATYRTEIGVGHAWLDMDEAMRT